MARIISPPKPRVVAPPPPPAAPPFAGLPPAAPAPAPPPGAVPPPAPADPVAQAVSQAAERSLLRRSLGRAGTVLTGWRGVLAPGALAPRRKTLLGG